MFIGCDAAIGFFLAFDFLSEFREFAETYNKDILL